MADTKIEWCDKSWNPIAGCTNCSPGCLNCYAERFANRFNRTYDTAGNLRPYYCQQGYNYDWKGLVACRPDVLNQPLDWHKPKRIFACSMSDLFHPKVPFSFIDRVFDIIDGCKQHIFLVLTKRAIRAYEYFSSYNYSHSGIRNRYLSFNKNIHFGVSISTQAEADEKIPIILQIPAAVRWLSIEPMLERIDLTRIWWETNGLGELHENFNAWVGINGVVVGCESGPKCRPCKLAWIESVIVQCIEANVPVFIKQINQGGKVVKMPKEYPQELPERR